VPRFLRFWVSGVLGFWVLGSWVLGLWVLGFWVLGFWVLGFWVLGFWVLGFWESECLGVCVVQAECGALREV
jgi:hypothetical protein